MAKTTDEKTLALINEVKIRKAEIAKLSKKTNWRTNCSFSFIEGTPGTNLQVESNIKTLISMAAFVRDHEKSYNETATALGIDSPPVYTWCGFPAAYWCEDIKTRIGKLQITAKQKKLEILENRLNAVISPELRAEMELEAISQELK